MSVIYLNVIEYQEIAFKIVVDYNFIHLNHVCISVLGNLFIRESQDQNTPASGREIYIFCIRR